MLGRHCPQIGIGPCQTWRREPRGGRRGMEWDGRDHPQSRRALRRRHRGGEGARPPARREIMIGAHRDPVFGPVVAVGDGGKYVEIFRDTALLLPPFSKAEAAEALQRLRIAPLFAGVRGESPMDVGALCDSVMCIGELMLDPTARVMSLDLNPVLLDSTGKGCVVVDAVVFQG